MVDVKKKKTSKQEPIIEEEDKRVIVFIVIAVLVIIAIAICLLVGCDKKENNDDIINTPNEIDRKDDEEKKDIIVDYEEYDDDEEETIVKTTTSKKYEVTFKFNNETIVKKVKKGQKVTKYSPKGYSCKYYENKELTKEFNFDKKITSDKKIYMSCDEIEYKLIFDVETESKKTYHISDGNVKLDSPTDKIIEENGITKVFSKWSLDKGTLVDITHIDENAIDYANKKNEIHIYAFYTTDVKVTYVSNGVRNTSVIEAGKKVTMKAGNCESENFLGWSVNNDKVINYKENQEVNIYEDVTLYAVCASTIVEYISEEEKVEVAYTESDLEDYVAPTPEDLDMKIPTYYVPVKNETSTTKKVVSDNTLDMLENQIKQSDAAKKSAEGYTPEVDDIIEEIEKEFTGWEKEVPSKVKGEEPKKEKIEENYKPKKDTTEKLEATWKETIKYEDEVIDNSEQNSEEI